MLTPSSTNRTGSADQRSRLQAGCCRQYFCLPDCGYSKKIKSLDELQDGSQVAIPNDPTNLGRSLLLLQKVGLIKLKDGVGLLPTALDVIENPKNLKLVELEAPQLPRSLDDAQIALAVINTTYASQIGLTPAKTVSLLKIKILRT